ncbi:MAG: hypothetical protein L0323_04285 [Planctomycetes bacterium]|nr:hypothetical protein [Planctomycetota bacterium]
MKNFLVGASLLPSFSLPPSPAHSAPGTARVPQTAWRRAADIQEVGGRLVALGPDYRAEFAAEGWRFTPALGRRAERTRFLSYSLESIRRGEEVLFERGGAPASPERDGSSVRYCRGAGIVESYEVRPDGIEQTFRFAERPPGTGDLVVRGRIETNLPFPVLAEDGGLRFEEGGLGGVAYGAATGLDAAGRRAPGTLRVEGDLLEIALPSAFVDAAALPILLDPLVGSAILLAGGGLVDYANPDIAYDATSDLYLVVWESVLSAVQIEVRAVRVASSGAIVGPVFNVQAGVGMPQQPAVASLNATNRFLVVWRELVLAIPPHFNVMAKTVDAATGAVSVPIMVSTSPAPDLNPDVGGDPRVGPAGSFEDGLVAWTEVGAGIRARLVRCPASGPPSLPGPVLVLTTEASADYAAVSKSCGSPGRWLLAWEEYGDLEGVVLDASGTACTPESPIAASPAYDSMVDVAGDGTGFLATWQRGGAGARDILLRPFSFSGDCGSGSLTAGAEFVLEGDPGDDETSTAVDLAQDKYVVAWADREGTPTFDLYMAAVDRASGLPCEPATGVVISTATEGSPAVGAQFGGGATSDQALVAWVQVAGTVSTNTSVLAHRVESLGPGGPVVDVGGGCGGGGFGWVNGPVAIANADFAFTLSGADPGATGSLVLVAPAASNFPCGPCTLVPDLSASAVLSAQVSGGGAAIAVPIPCNLALLGGGAKVQWIVFPTSASPCSSGPNVSLSNAIDATVGL